MLTRAKTTQPDAHRIHYQQLMDNNLANQEEIIAALKSSFKGTLIIPFAKRWIKVAVNLIPLPEHLKYIIMQYFQLIRNEIGIIREYLIENNKINSEDDIWYLRSKEIQEAIMHPSKDYSQLIQERKTLYNHFKKLTPPLVITSTGEIPRVSFSRKGLPPGALMGSAVSAGYVEGTARVILDPSQQQLQPGEILVVPYTDPGWIPLFINAADIVLETGGLMTHGSVGRE